MQRSWPAAAPHMEIQKLCRRTGKSRAEVLQNPVLHYKERKEQKQDQPSIEAMGVNHQPA